MPIDGVKIIALMVKPFSINDFCSHYELSLVVALFLEGMLSKDSKTLLLAAAMVVIVGGICYGMYVSSQPLKPKYELDLGPPPNSAEKVKKMFDDYEKKYE